MESDISKGPVIGQRHVQTLLLFGFAAINYMTRYSASISLVAMTNSSTTNPNFPQYNWNESEKSYILSSFFWGYLFTQLFAGYYCKRFGEKVTLFTAIFGSSLVGLILPITLKFGDWQIFCAVRVVQGVFQGLDLSGAYALLANWCPVEERNRLGALAFSGNECGTLMAMLLSGLIAISALGWPGISYIFCGIGLIWCLLWIIFGASSPNTSKFISLEEKTYIQISKKETVEGSKKSIPIPWKAILLSPAFWALIVARCSEAWSFTAVQAALPEYMNGVFCMDMKNNTLYSALPYILLWVMSYVYLILADLLINYKILSLNALRKTFNSIAFWIPAICLIGIGFLKPHQQIIAGILMIVIVGINAGNMIGSGLNVIDLSPNHTDILMSILNAAGSIMPMLNPLVMAAVVHDDSDDRQWQILFIICALIYFVGNIIYLIWGSTDAQPWNDPNFLLPKCRDDIECSSDEQQSGRKDIT
ncbi:putative inorganic phosphate cotransporter [Musca domestica]|uniref:Putative inorganic phosphate cotransporter n=1 Tax=Musca domestica TaxID=7370 RepID=A0A1I8MNR9_MUSDO|nr:putative inorganic phosphate cotransporter [Musca domestica]